MAFDAQQNDGESPVICMIGTVGHGKSAFGNMLLGSNKPPFNVTQSGDVEEGTLKCKASQGMFLWQTDLSFTQGEDVKTSDEIQQYLAIREEKFHAIKVIDTAGMGTNLASQRVADIINFIIETKNVNVIALIVKSSENRIDPLKDVINEYGKYIDKNVLFNHLIVVFTHWELDAASEKKRLKKDITKENVAANFFTSLRNSYPKIDALKESNTSQIPYIFISCDAFTDEEVTNVEKMQHLTQLIRFYNIAKTKNKISITLKNNNAGSCFGNNCKVIKYDKNLQTWKECLVKDIKIGDNVETMDGFKKVIHIHKPLVNEAIVYEIKQENEEIISLTAKHLIYVNGQKEPIYAFQLNIGDILQCQNNKLSKIIGIKVVIITDGVGSIITENGELIVQGCRVSSYAYSTKLHQLVKVKKLARILPNKTQKRLQNLVINMLASY